MLLEHLVLRVLTLGVLIAALSGCGGDARPRDDAEVVAALGETLERLGTRSGEAFRAGFTARGFEDFTREWWGVTTTDFAAGGADLDAAVAEGGYGYEGMSAVRGSRSRVEVSVREQGRADLSEDRFVLVRSDGRWLIDAFDPRSVSPAVPAGYTQIAVEVREYEIVVGQELPALPRPTAFSIRNDGDVEHVIALLWLEARVPTEGFFFGVAEAWPPMIEPYGDVRIAPGETQRLIPRQPLSQRGGRYVLYCTLGERGPSHAQLGMLEELPAR